MTDELRDHTEIADLEDEYEIVGEIGRGGSAIVYHGRDRALGREVAIKVVRPRFAAPDNDDIARLAREARTVAQLEHPNIVTVHAVKRLRDEGLALVMQFVPGRTLKQTVVEDGPLPPDRAERIIRDVAQALAYANSRGVVHRDVKPENIFIDSTTGRAMLSDFGIAHSAEFDSRLTMTGTAIGTPAYMAPEQIDGAAANARSDVYSLGLVAWEMLTGHRPWEGESLYSVIYKQKNEQLPPIDDYNSAVPPRLQYIIERMLQKKPAARWAGADGLLAHLNASVLPSDWNQWQEAHRRRKLTRPVQRSRAAALVSAALATIRFQRPPAGVTEGVRENGDPDALTPANDMANASVEDDRPSWATEATHARTTSRLPLVAAVALLLVTGSAVAVYAVRDRDAEAAAAAVPTLTDVGSVELPVGARVDLQRVGGESLAGSLGVDSASRPALDLPRDTTTVVYARPLQPNMPPAEPPSPPATATTSAAPTGPARANPSTPPAGLAARTGSPASTSAAASSSIDASSFDASTTVRSTDDRGIIAAGGRHSCVLQGTRLLCWGANDEGQLGDGELESRTTPADIVGDIDFVQVSAGIAHSCGVTRTGEAYCWGSDDRGQLGDATSTSRSAPVRIASSMSFRSIKAGRGHTCGLTSASELACWGSNSNGQLGDGTTTNRSTPVKVANASRFISIAVGWNHTCAINTIGVAYCWGDNSAGQLGDNTHTDHATPLPIDSDLRFTSIAAGSAHTCAVAVSGETWCWGRNSYGQLGLGNSSDRTSPTRVDGAVRFTSVSAGSVHTCGRSAGGVVFCWGRNSYGQLGDGTTTDRSRPVRVAGVASFAAVNATGAHTCAVTGEGETSCWGYNVDGQLGDGTRTHHSRPVRVTVPSR